MGMQLLVNFITCIVGCLIAALIGRFFRKPDPMRFFKAAIVALAFSWQVSLVAGHGGAIVPLPSAVTFALYWPWINRDKYPAHLDAEFISNEIYTSYAMLLGSVVSFGLVYLSYWTFSRSSKSRSDS
jgi:hypothetical protein